MSDNQHEQPRPQEDRQLFITQCAMGCPLCQHADPAKIGREPACEEGPDAYPCRRMRWRDDVAA